MDHLTTKGRCNGCHACYQACPVAAISMQPDTDGFLYPVIDAATCINCGKCDRVCPVLNPPTLNPLEDAYACYAADPEVHSASSSGGVFAVLAEEILSDGGVVFGAAFDETMQVHHLAAETPEQLQALKQTKYVQSAIGSTYAEAERFLQAGRPVLFSGTPCQIAGLKNYLGKEYPGLVTMDLICHGVPAPGIWEQYLQDISGGRPIKTVTFRNKRNGMGHVTLDYTLQDGTVIQENYGDSLYIKGFIQNLYIRPSCTHCPFKGAKRCSDITVGDFWGAKEHHPNMVNPKGVSAVLLHSEKAKSWLEYCSTGFVLEKSTSEKAALWNESMLQPAKPSPNCEQFRQMLATHPLTDAIGANLVTPTVPKVSLLSKVKGRVKKWLA